MNITEAKRKLQEIIYEKYVISEEYQDKYYLKKQIQIIFPDLSEPIIYAAINTANITIRPPRKKDDFINVLVLELFPKYETKFAE
jgi:hypothetical protein